MHEIYMNEMAINEIEMTNSSAVHHERYDVKIRVLKLAKICIKYNYLVIYYLRYART